MNQRVGWVPTANGRLTFSNIVNHPTSRYARVAYRDSALMIFWRLRNTSDTTFPFVGVVRKFLDRRRGKIGQFGYVFFGRTLPSDVNVMEGDVHMFVADAFHDRVRPHVDHVMDGIRAMSRSHVQRKESYIRQFSIEDQLLHYVETEAIASCRFRLERNGRISISDTLVKLEHEGPEAEGMVACQFYYLIRDAMHSHKFHDARTDTISGIFDEQDWEIETQHALFRKCVNYRRIDTVAALQRAIGVATYIAAFQSQFSVPGQNSRFTTGEFIRSLEASLAIAEKKESQKLAFVASSVALFFTIWACLLATAMFTDLGAEKFEFNPHPYFVAVAELANSMPIFLFAACLTFAVICATIANVKINMLTHGDRDARRLLIGMGRPASLVFLVVGALLFGVPGIYGVGYVIDSGVGLQDKGRETVHSALETNKEADGCPIPVFPQTPHPASSSIPTMK